MSFEVKINFKVFNVCIEFELETTDFSIFILNISDSIESYIELIYCIAV